jgi:hypothetical protein
MRIAAGFKAHSGWAALVVIGSSDGGFVVVAAAETCGLNVRTIPEKRLPPTSNTTAMILGKSAGPPWGKDQKSAVLAAISIVNGG